MQRIRLLYAPDDGAGAGTATAEPAAGPGAAPAAAETVTEPAAPGAAAIDKAAETLKGNEGDKGTAPPEAPKPSGPPKLASQLSPEAREKHKEALEAMGPDVSLTDAFNDLVDTKGRLARSILLPKEGDLDDVKRFMKDMGIPETQEGYEIDSKVLGEDATKLITEQAMKSGMTKRQAKTMHGLIAAMVKNGKAGFDAAAKELSESFDTRLAEAAGSKEAGDAARKYATKFLIRFGDKKTLESLERTGMIYNTTFMLKLAEFEKALGDTKYVGGTPPPAAGKGGEKKGAFGTYNSDFTDRYGGAK